MPIKRHPSYEQYVAAMTIAARDNPKLTLQNLLSPECTRSIAHGRWRGWKLLHELKFSIAGIAATGGFDHTTVLHGLRQIEKMEQVGADRVAD